MWEKSCEGNLEEAKRVIEHYELQRAAGNYRPGGKLTKHVLNVAQAYAAIAQAEQLKRIADCLESSVGSWDGVAYIRTRKIDW